MGEEISKVGPIRAVITKIQHGGVGEHHLEIKLADGRGGFLQLAHFQGRDIELTVADRPRPIPGGYVRGNF